jgi:hypothetical protein
MPPAARSDIDGFMKSKSGSVHQRQQDFKSLLSQRRKLALTQQRALCQINPKTGGLVEALYLLRHNGFDCGLKII